jgi:probable FeS assembly SUF system protein SufT
MSSHTRAALVISRAVETIEIPAGTVAVLPEGTEVFLLQDLGGSYTVHVPGAGGLFRIDGKDADALGLSPAPIVPDAGETRDMGPLGEEAVWEALRGCYDPEIPVNVVELGLIYDLSVAFEPGRGSHVEVKMTLTAPGCGMGPAIAADARSRIERIPGTRSAAVHLVWDPPWSAEMMSPEARTRLGIG